MSHTLRLFRNFFCLWSAFLSWGYLSASTIDNELIGKVVTGYQGWFAPEGDGTNMGWFHYGAGHEDFRPGACTFDMWPDLSEFGAAERYPTPFHFADGKSATVFSSANATTVNRHFAWMREYGIDGAALQRFGQDLRSPKQRAWRDRVLANCRQAASTNGRIWFIMYDLSGLRENDLMEVVAADWKRLIDESDFRKDATYTHAGGKPLVAVWGVGFGDGRGYSLEATRRLIEFFKHDPHYGGNAVMLGVPYFWREPPKAPRESDAVPLATAQSLYELADVLSPWAVTRNWTMEMAEATGPGVIAPDLVWCAQRNITYLPVFFPGFSWHNLEKSRGREARLNGIPRQGGRFFWAQAASALKAGGKTAYVAMFDEIDEGTAIFKVTGNPPVGASPFATYEGLSSDYYLWLTGEIGRALRHPETLSPALPSRSK